MCAGINRKEICERLVIKNKKRNLIGAAFFLKRYGNLSCRQKCIRDRSPIENQWHLYFLTLGDRISVASGFEILPLGI